MQNQTNSVLNLISKLQNPTQTDNVKEYTNEFFKKFRENIKHKKKLHPTNFKKLKELINKDEFYAFLENEFTKNESIVIGRALMQSKILNKQKLVDFLANKDHISSIIILQCFLCTKAKIDVTKVVKLLLKYLDNPICETLKLMLIIHRNYTEFFDDNLTDFCRRHKHGITKEILDEIDQNN